MISIIIPVIRPEKAMVCISAIKEHIYRGPTSLEFEIISERDTEGIGCPQMVKRLVSKARGDYVMFLGDDTVPQPGFLDAAIKAMNSLPDGWGVVGLATQDDQSPDGCNWQAHWMAHKKMLEHIPGGDFFPTEYRHCYCDNELFNIANELGRWAPAVGAKILHDHPINETAGWDDGYKKAYDPGAQEADWKTYHRRKIERKGFNLAVGVPLTGTVENRRFSSSYRHACYTYIVSQDPEHIRFKEYEPDIPIGRFNNDICDNRNDLIKQALKDGVSHLVMMDSDQIYPQDILTKLAAWAKKGKGNVIGPVHRRYDPFELLLMRGKPTELEYIPEEEKYSGKLIEVDAGGAGCIMFSLLDILDLGSDNWFSFEKTKDGKVIGEDINFCYRLKQAGHRIWADTSIEIGHIAEIVINREFHEMWKRLNGITLL
jgi:GT2 family glycosyltransferase